MKEKHQGPREHPLGVGSSGAGLGCKVSYRRTLMMYPVLYVCDTAQRVGLTPAV